MPASMKVLQAPRLRAPEDHHAWFRGIASTAMNRWWLVLGNSRFRLQEIECYYFSEKHPDPFAHRQPLQQCFGRWYFHRVGSSYRGGTFKGLDFTFGSNGAYAAFLIRTMNSSETGVISGPCRIVEYALHCCGVTSVADLDQQIGERQIWDTTSPIHITSGQEPTNPLVITECPRIGLSLKRAAKDLLRVDFLFQPYRYLVEQKQIPGNRVLLVLTLLKRGMSPEEIHATTGCPLRTIQRYAQERQKGRHLSVIDDFFGRELSARDLCQLHGFLERDATK